MKQLLSALILACYALCLPLYSGNVEPIDHPAITEILNELPHYGVLKQRDGDGFIYLKVSEEYLDRLFTVIQEIFGDELVKGSSLVGAHVSVIRPNIGEPVFWNIAELDSTFDFIPLRMGTVVPDLDPKWERVWILEIHSQALEDLRVSYGLSPRVGNSDNEFHITIATKLREGGAG